MCLALPGKVLSLESEKEPLYRYGEVDFSGIKKRVSLGFVPEVQIGDFVLVHVGMAIQVIDREEADKIMEYIGQLGVAEELGEPPKR